MRLQSLIAVASLFGAILPGCDSGRSQRQVDAPDDAVPTLAMSDSPTVRLGGHDDRPDYQFGDVVGALRLSDGRLVVADAVHSELRYYDSRGQYLGAIGGEGNGPGEFERLGSIDRGQGDTTVVWDRVQDRLTLLPPDYQGPATTYTLPAWNDVMTALQGRSSRHLPVGGNIYPLSGGKLLFEPILQPMQPFTITEVVQDTLPLMLIDRSALQWVEIGQFPANERFNHGGTSGLLPFGSRLHMALSDSLVYLGSGLDRVVHVISGRTGAVLGSVSLPMERRALEEEEIEVYKSERVASFIGSAESFREYLDAIPYPDSLPVFSDLRVASDGDLWVREASSPTDVVQRWQVFDPTDLEHVVTVTMDAGAQLMDAGRDFVLIGARDDLDVEEVRLHQLDAVPPAP